jgi:hypothetical protein
LRKRLKFATSARTALRFSRLRYSVRLFIRWV